MRGMNKGASVRGFGSGLIWGGVISALGLIVVSETMPFPGDLTLPEAQLVAEAAPEAPAAPEAVGAAAPEAGEATAASDLDVPAGSEFAKALPETDPVVPEATTTPSSDATPVVPAPGSSPALPGADTETAAAPEAGVTVPDAPVAPAPDATLPEVSSGASVTEGAEGTAPAADAPAEEAPPGDVDLPPPPPLTPEEKALVETAPEPEAMAEAPQVDPEAMAEAPQVDPEAAAVAPDAGAEEPAVEPEVATDAPTITPDAPLPGLGDAADDDGGPLAGDEAERPATGFSGEVAGVKTGRLPRIGDAPAATDDDLIVLDDTALQPIERFAARFENPDGKPVFSILLIDSGDPGLDRAALAALPFPVTFALDPLLPDVAGIAAGYREAGQEIVMLATSIPAGATPADLEVTFEAHGAALPEAVAVMDLAEGGFQGDRMLASQVIPIIQAQGRGLLTYDAGLNPADQVASRDGVRAATIFRRLDADGEAAPTIRRYLDRAAFRAAQTGRVVVVGETRPETVAALVEWAVEGRAAAVAIAPVTAALVAR